MADSELVQNTHHIISFLVNDFYGSDSSLCNHWPFALEQTPSFDTLLPRLVSQVPNFVLSRLLSSLYVSRTGSASDWCTLQVALYKCTYTLKYHTIHVFPYTEAASYDALYYITGPT